MNLLKLVAFLPVARACSYVEIPYEEGGKTKYVIPRTMELWDLLGGAKYSIQAFPRSKDAKYGWVAPINHFHFPPEWNEIECNMPGQNAPACQFEGMNEVGLTVSALWFSQAIYETPTPGKPELWSWSVAPAILANCSTVEETIKFLESVTVVPPKTPGVPEQVLQLATFHWAITDPSGRSIVVEYLQGKRTIYENHPRVMTNDPDLKWHWRNLNTRVDLSPNFPTDNEFMQVKLGEDIGAVPRPVGHGWNLHGLPGDTTSPSRFLRLFYLRGYATAKNPVKSYDDAVVLGTGLLNNVFIPFGVVAEDSRVMGDGPEFTDYGVLKSPQEKLMLVRGYRNTQWRQIDLKKLDFTKHHYWPMEDGTLGITDITTTGTKTAAKRADL